MKKTLCLILSVVLAMTCAACNGETDVSSSVVTEATEYHYEFNPHVYASIYEENFDEGTKRSFFSFCDALLAGEEEFDCPDEVTLFNIRDTISGQCMPLADSYVTFADPAVSGGKGHLIYTIPKDEYLAKVDEFKEIINSIMEECIRPGFDDTDKALALYHYFEEHYTYDYDVLDDDSTPLSSYRLFTRHKGICQEIAPAYAYLMLQAGVDCTTCGSLNDVNEAHEWAFARLDGKYYHIDPTWVMTDPQTLAYFGMTDDQREAAGGWDKSLFNFGTANIFDDRGEYRASDTRFEKLWDSVSYEVDYDTNTVSFYRLSDSAPETFVY